MTHDLPGNYTPLHTYFLPNALEHEHGEKIIKEGKVGAIILAGGHGSRLGFNAPKGCFPINNKSLYQLFAEKTLEASTFYGQDLHLAIMTSDATHDVTVQHFKDANFFGLNTEQVVFFQQQNLPLQDDAGNVVYGPDKRPLTAPDGNGGLFWHFAQSGAFNSWQQAGIEHVVVFTVDNALADPFEANLIGLHALHKNDVTVVGVARETPEEHVGVLVEQNSHVAVIEYSEMPDSERLSIDAGGALKYPLANISYFAFSLEFIKKVLLHPVSEMPLHKAKKKVRIGSREEYLYKSEYFIFDVLTYSRKAEVLVLPREDIFAPLKNKTGSHSPATVQAALEAFVHKKQNE